MNVFHSVRNGIQNTANKAKVAYNNYQEEQKRKRELEEQRQDKIRTGQIDPLIVAFNLDDNEKAYAKFDAKRYALVEYTYEKTVGSSKRKGTLGRAVVGGILLGPVGALGGAMTAGKKYESTTITETKEEEDQIDTGTLLITNKRIIFTGEKQVVSLFHKEIIAAEFSRMGYRFALKYPTMLKGEYFVLDGEQAGDSELYYQGIINHLVSKEEKIS